MVEPDPEWQWDQRGAKLTWRLHQSDSWADGAEPEWWLKNNDQLRTRVFSWTEVMFKPDWRLDQTDSLTTVMVEAEW
jgi:arabinogalactan endo-1,4-beta-galactosidase